MIPQSFECVIVPSCVLLIEAHTHCLPVDGHVGADAAHAHFLQVHHEITT